MQGFKLRNKFLNNINIVWLPASGAQLPAGAKDKFTGITPFIPN